MSFYQHFKKLQSSESDHDRYLQLEKVPDTYPIQEAINAKQIYSPTESDGSSGTQSAVREEHWRSRECGAGVQQSRREIREAKHAEARRTQEEAQRQSESQGQVPNRKTAHLGPFIRPRRFPDAGTV